MARLQYLAYVEPLAATGVPEATTPDRWQGEAPDRFPPRQPLCPEGFSVRPLEPSLTEAPPALSWEPCHPDSAPGLPPIAPRRLGALERPLEPSLTEAPPALSWAPCYPDRASGLPPVRQRLGALERPLEPSLTEPPPHLAWAPCLPDRAPGAAPRPHGGVVASPEPTQVVELLSWASQVQAPVRAFALRPQGWQAPPPEQGQPQAVVVLDWLVVPAAPAPRRRLPLVGWRVAPLSPAFAVSATPRTGSTLPASNARVTLPVSSARSTLPASNQRPALPASDQGS